MNKKIAPVLHGNPCNFTTYIAMNVVLIGICWFSSAETAFAGGDVSTWITPGEGYWSTAENWDVPPDGGRNAYISGLVASTVYIDAYALAAALDCGANLSISGGGLALLAPSTISGSLWINGSELTLLASSTISGPLTLSYATLNIGQSITLGQLCDVGGQSFLNGGSVFANGGIRFSGGANTLQSVTVETAVDTLVESNLDLRYATFHQTSGTFDVQSGTVHLFTGSAFNGDRLVGQTGTLLILDQPGSALHADSVSLDALTCFGSFEVETLAEFRGPAAIYGTIVGLGQQTIVNGGAVQLYSNSVVQFNDLTLSNYGTVLAGNPIRINGTLAWEAGGFLGTGPIDAYGPVNITGIEHVLQSTFSNHGACTMSGGLITINGGGAGFENYGTLELEGGSVSGLVLRNNAGGTIQSGGQLYLDSSIENAGLFSITGSEFSMNGNYQQSDGELRIAGGVLAMNGNYQQSGGELRIAGGAIVSSTYPIQINNGAIRFSGDANTLRYVTVETAEDTLVQSSLDLRYATFHQASGTFDVQSGTVHLFTESVFNGDRLVGHSGTSLILEPGSALHADSISLDGLTCSGNFEVDTLCEFRGPAAFGSNGTIGWLGQQTIVNGGTVQFYDWNSVVQFNDLALLSESPGLSTSIVQASGPIRIDGTLTWEDGGGFQGGGPIDAYGPVNISGYWHSLQSTFNNHGACTMGFGGINGGSFENYGTFATDGGWVSGPMRNYAGGTIQTSGYIPSYANIENFGLFSITGGAIDMIGTYQQFSGELRIAGGTRFNLTNPVTIYDGLVSGTGTIQINNGATFSLLGSSVMDLSNQITGACADPAESPNWGTVEVLNGTLLVQDATVRNTNIDVRNITAGGATQIVNNDIRLRESIGGGGEFFVGGAATIRCNVIRSDGDRFLDLDPDPTLPPEQRPTVEDNRIYVTIIQGTGLEQGELLELRSKDDDISQFGGLSGAHQMGSSAGDAQGSGYHDTWALERLILEDGAKVTLTNRQGFDFQTNDTIPEALYVKEVVLGEDSVLNTGLQRLYYQTLVNNGGQIVDNPLLGFSLKVIAMEDDTEFDVRVRRRLRDPADDPQPASPPFKEGAITREVDPTNGSNGVMRMKTQAPCIAPNPCPLSATSVAAHGSFARAGEDTILVQFNYLFCGQATDELVVYLSDSPEPRDTDGPEWPDHFIEVARLSPPASGPGAVGSGQFATFSGRFPRGSLNFTRGTYVELELRGSNACILIDDWDPAVCLWCACGDFSGDSSCGVEEVDYLYLLSEFGNAAGGLNNCADALCPDNYVDMSDLLAWSSMFHDPVVLNLCEGGGGSSAGGTSTAVAIPSSEAIIAGKPAGVGMGDTLAGQDMLYPVDMQTHIALAGLAAPGKKNDVRSGNGRLLADDGGALYQLHGVMGLIRLSDGQVVAAPQIKSFGGSTVRIGLGSAGGYPLADAAFEPGSSTIVYVTPVQVDPPAPTGAGCPYRATAKLQVTGGGNYNVLAIFGANPFNGSAVTADACSDYVYSPDASHVREVEVDAHGNLFVAAAQQVNDNDYVLIYPAGSGAEIRKSLAGQVEAPSALYVEGDKLYMTTSMDDGNLADTVIYRYGITRDGGNHATNLEFETAIIITGMRFVTAMATNPADGSLWAVGYSADFCSAQQCSANPECPGGCSFQQSDPIATTPKLAVITNPGGASPSEAVSTITGADLALPLSVIILSTLCGTGDFDGSGLSVSDIPLFTAAILNPIPAALCPGDMNIDGALNGKDIQPFCDLLIP